MTKSDTIVAVSTPFGLGGIAVVRLSGPSATKVADEFFCAKSGIKLKDAKHALMNFGTLQLDGFVDHEWYGGILVTASDLVELTDGVLDGA